MVLESLEILPSRQHIGHGFFFKPHSGGYVYRLAPDRHPAEPRFWCIWIHRCGPGGVPDADERAWLSDETITRDEMPVTLSAIRDDLANWLATRGEGLCAWLDEPAPVPVKR
ncbi:MAG: hypothetical protein ACRD1H_05870 [Vicinamibacterales bacterium]